MLVATCFLKAFPGIMYRPLSTLIKAYGGFIYILCSLIDLTGNYIHVQVLHYVEKPETFVSNIINAGGYIFSPDIFQHLAQAFTANYENELM